MKILVIQQKMLGDVLLSSILVTHLKSIYPTSEIHYLVNKGLEPVLENNLNINKVITIAKNDEKTLSGILSSIKKIRQHKYDIIIDAYAKNFSYLLTLFSGSKKKISFKKGYNFFIYTDLVERIIPIITDRGYAVKNRLILLDPLTDGKSLDTTVKPQIYLNDDEIKIAKSKIEQKKINSKFSFMVSAIGSNHEKTYPLKYM